MLLKIDFDPKHVVMQSEGRLVIKLPTAEGRVAARLCSVRGQTAEDFVKNPVKVEARLVVGVTGAIFARRHT